MGAGAPCRLVMYAADPKYESTYVKSKKPRADVSKTLRTAVTREELTGVKNQDNLVKALENQVKVLDDRVKTLLESQKALDDRVKTLEQQNFVSSVWGAQCN